MPDSPADSLPAGPLPAGPPYVRRIADRQLGRNAQLFAEAIGALPTAEERFRYVRILVALIESAHPEWNQAPQKGTLVSDLVGTLSAGRLNAGEVADVVRVRDEERGIATA